MSKVIKVIYAHGIHSGGGLTLLKMIFRETENCSDYWFILDSRCITFAKKYNLQKVDFFPPGIFGRLRAELAVKRSNVNRVLSFNSLPFLTSMACSVTVFFQNVNLVNYSYRQSLAGFMRRILFRVRSAQVDKFITQTQSVFDLVSKETGKPCVISTLLDLDMSKCLSDRVPIHNLSPRLNARFIYVADGSAHKNHEKLIHAWKIFKQTFKDFKGELVLTLDLQKGEIWEEIKQLYDVEALSIVNLGVICRETILSEFKCSDALLFPSLKESLGLPLIEAEMCGLDVIASERDFARDVVDPVEVFDPESSVSIARALARYLGLHWPSAIRPVTAHELLKEVFDD